MKNKEGTLYGVNWEKHDYGIYCYAMGGNFYLVSFKYVGNGSDKLNVRDCVKHFRENILGK